MTLSVLVPAEAAWPGRGSEAAVVFAATDAIAERAAVPSIASVGVAAPSAESSLD